jgi:hypothetical protein
VISVGSVARGDTCRLCFGSGRIVRYRFIAPSEPIPRVSVTQPVILGEPCPWCVPGVVSREPRYV